MMTCHPEQNETFLVSEWRDSEWTDSELRIFNAIADFGPTIMKATIQHPIFLLLTLSHAV